MFYIGRFGRRGGWRDSSSGGSTLPEFDNAIRSGCNDVSVSLGGGNVRYSLFVHVGDGIVGGGGDVG